MRLRARGSGPRPLVSSLLLSAALSTRVSAWGGFGYSDGGGLYPYSASSQPWEEAVATSNASAVFSIPGRDVTKPYPGSPMDGWTLNITAVDLTPYELGWDLRIIAPESLYTTVDPKTISNETEADNVRLAGGKVIQNVNSDWIVCNYISWGGNTFEKPEDAPKDLHSKPDGDCSPWLSDSCIKAIEKTASTSWATDYDMRINPFDARALCLGFKLPDECNGTSLDFPDWPWSLPDLPTRYLTGATTTVNGWEFQRQGDDPGFNPEVSDAPLMWKAATKDFAAVVTMFGHYKANASSDDVEPGFTKVSCIRPESRVESKSTQSDSGKPGAKGSDDKDEKSAASVLGVSIMALMGMLAMI